MPGVGVFKSSDGGLTFAHAGLADTHTIARILIHPTNPDIVYVAASGHAWTENEMRGVFKTTDGGRTWTQGALQGPGHRRHRSGDGSVRPEHAVCGNVAAHAAQVERPARRTGRQRERRLEIDRRRTHVDRREPRAARRHRRAAESASTPPRSNPKVLYAFVDNYEAGRPARRRRARRVRPPDHGSAHQGGRDLSQRRPRRYVAQGQRQQRVHERTLGDLRLGVRPDSRRSHRREHDLHARPRPQRLARRRQDVRGARAAHTATITGCGSIRRSRRRSTARTTEVSICPTMRASPGTMPARRAACSSTT